jgi:hypothetical protein
MRLRSYILTTIILLLLPATVRAWGGDGHQIVCLIAEERLSPAAKAGIRELLGKANISDAEIASYADIIRRERTETGPWHYVDIPFDAEKFDAQRDGNNGENVVNKIDALTKVLADRDAPKAERAEALKFLVHFVGDIHQPLHCTDRNGDRGGNTRLVFFLDTPKATDLHSCWDTTILLHHKGNERVLDYAMALNKKITADDADKWTKSTPEDWANESHALAVKVVYANIPADGPPPKLDQGYVNNAASVIGEQLEKAGVRLAMILSRCFTERATTAAGS